MRTPRPILLASAAAAVLIAAACARDVTAPGGRTIAGGAVSPTAGLFSVSPDTTGTDSVVAGYGSNPCGGLEYLGFEYEPETGTEYVVCADTTVTPTDTTRTPKPANPAPAPAPAPAPTPKDSVVTGYGNENTGGYP